MNKIINNFKIEKERKSKNTTIMIIVFIFITIIFSCFNLVIGINLLQCEEGSISEVYMARLNGSDVIVSKDFITKKRYMNVDYEYCKPLPWGGCRNESKNIIINLD